MEELFNMLSASARFHKKKKGQQSGIVASPEKQDKSPTEDERSDDGKLRARDRTGKRDSSESKKQQVHREEMAAFRRTVGIFLSNKHDLDVPDPISSFDDIAKPQWWFRESDNETKNDRSDPLFQNIHHAIARNIELGRWKEPTPIQMQSIPTIMHRRDFIGAAPTGSGKSGAFIIPSLFLSSASSDLYYKIFPGGGKAKSTQGTIRALLMAPSLELAAQLHREVERLGTGKMGGLSAMLLSKSNSQQIVSGSAGGKGGIDVLVSTPLRLVDAIGKGLKLGSVRVVVIDEADRLLDATDGGKAEKGGDDEQPTAASGSSQTQTFLAQMDSILSETPSSAVRALFSATVTPTVRSLAESILRNPVDVTISASRKGSAAANTDIDQKLTFVSNEQGKLLAIRQLVQNGEWRPPMIVFLQSQERAQALFEELLYDNIHVDVIHAGRSKAARQNSVAKFRKGETWVLICTDLVARGVDFRAVNMVVNYDLPASGITYVHRIGRTGRAGRRGTAITFFTEADEGQLRTIANIMQQSGCQVEEWMLNMKKSKRRQRLPAGQRSISTTARERKRRKQTRDESQEHAP